MRNTKVNTNIQNEIRNNGDIFELMGFRIVRYKGNINKINKDAPIETTPPSLEGHDLKIA